MMKNEVKAYLKIEIMCLSQKNASLMGKKRHNKTRWRDISFSSTIILLPAIHFYCPLLSVLFYVKQKSRSTGLSHAPCVKPLCGPPSSSSTSAQQTYNNSLFFLGMAFLPERLAILADFGVLQQGLIINLLLTFSCYLTRLWTQKSRGEKSEEQLEFNIKMTTQKVVHKLISHHLC